MGVLGKLTEMRRRQVLRRRFGEQWGSRLFDLHAAPDFDAMVDTSGNLNFAGVSAPMETRHLDALIRTPYWMNLVREEGLRFVIEDGELLATVDDLKLCLPEKDDYYTLTEVFHERLYGFHIPGDYAVMDVGANIGLSSLYFARHFGGPVRAYELVPSTAAQARRNLELNPEVAKRIELFEYGLAAKPGQLTIHIDPTNSACNSLYAAIGPEAVEVKLESASDELERMRAAHPGRKICLKLDAEGAEYEILDDLAQRDLLRHVAVLLLEWHRVEGRSPAEIRANLEKASFHWFERHHFSEPVGFVTAWRPQDA